MTLYILIIPTCIMTFCYVRITCVIWLRAGARCSTPEDIDMPRIHFVTSRRSPPAESTPRRRSYGRRPTHDHPRCHSSPRPFLSPPCSVGVPTKLAIRRRFPSNPADKPANEQTGGGVKSYLLCTQVIKTVVDSGDIPGNIFRVARDYPPSWP